MLTTFFTEELLLLEQLFPVCKGCDHFKLHSSKKEGFCLLFGLKLRKAPSNCNKKVRTKLIAHCNDLPKRLSV